MNGGRVDGAVAVWVTVKYSVGLASVPVADGIGDDKGDEVTTGAAGTQEIRIIEIKTTMEKIL